MDLIAEGTKWLREKQEEVASTPVFYRRGDFFTKANATLGKTNYQDVDDYGITLECLSVDFIISEKELPFKPEIGDEIQLKDKLYRVLSIPGQHCWRWSGIPGVAYRIHTKEIEDRT